MLFIRLKSVEIVLTGQDEANQLLSELEQQLASADKMAAQPDVLRKAQAELLVIIKLPYKIM